MNSANKKQTDYRQKSKQKNLSPLATADLRTTFLKLDTLSPFKLRQRHPCLGARDGHTQRASPRIISRSYVMKEQCLVLGQYGKVRENDERQLLDPPTRSWYHHPFLLIIPYSLNPSNVTEHH
jgi:hypothetical protein